MQREEQDRDGNGRRGRPGEEEGTGADRRRGGEGVSCSAGNLIYLPGRVYCPKKDTPRMELNLNQHEIGKQP